MGHVNASFSKVYFYFFGRLVFARGPRFSPAPCQQSTHLSQPRTRAAVLAAFGPRKQPRARARASGRSHTRRCVLSGGRCAVRLPEQPFQQTRHAAIRRAPHFGCLSDPRGPAARLMARMLLPRHTALLVCVVALLVLCAPPAHAKSSSTKTKAGCSCQDEYELGDYGAKYTGQCGHDGTGVDKPLKCKQKDDACT